MKLGYSVINFPTVVALKSNDWPWPTRHNFSDIFIYIYIHNQPIARVISYHSLLLRATIVLLDDG